MAITYALMQRFEELSDKEPDRVQLVKKAKVSKIKKDGHTVTGVTYTFNNEEISVDGPVILATGGYAADFGETSLLKKWRPDTFDLASTNGQHATGDGHKMLISIGANDIDMDKVQVHPTGLVDPKDPGSKWKFLAAEGRLRLSPSSLRVFANSSLQHCAVRVACCSTTKANVSSMSSSTVTSSQTGCLTKRRMTCGPSDSSSTPKPLTFSTFTHATTPGAASCAR